MRTVSYTENGRNAGVALILDGHSRAALETLQSIGQRGLSVDLAAERDCLGWKSCYCRTRLVQPDTSDATAFIVWLIERFIQGNYRLVVPSTEASLRCLMLLPESHPIRRAAVLPPNRGLEIALNKQRTWDLARAVGVRVPASRLIESKEYAHEPRALPAVLKPASSVVRSGSRLVGVAPVIVTVRDEWSQALDRLLPLCPVMEQEYIMGCGVGIECLYRLGSCVWYFQHERLHELPLTGGGSSYRRSSPIDERLLAAATRLLDSLEWHGVAMVEFKGSVEDGYRLMEINPRLWGSLALPIDAGVDFPAGLWCLANGEDPGPQPQYRFPYYTRNLRMDIDWLKENLRADHGNPLLLTSPRLRSLVEYGRPLLGKESWDHFDIKDRRVWSHILLDMLESIWRTASLIVRKALRFRIAIHHHHSVLRRLATIHSGGPSRILFVCYGNICRSPLAEIHARKINPKLDVRSAGFHEITNRQPPEWYQRVVAELGVDISACRSTRIDRQQVEWAQLILLADFDNLDCFKREFPKSLNKTTMLGFFLPTPRAVIDDPYNLNPSDARVVAQDIRVAVESLVAWLRAQQDG